MKLVRLQKICGKENMIDKFDKTEEQSEPSLIVPSTSIHSKYKRLSFHDIIEESRVLLQKHSHFDTTRLTKTHHDGGYGWYYWGPELTNKTRQTTSPEDNRAIDAIQEYTLQAYRDTCLPSEGNPMSFLAKGFKQYFKVSYWSGRNFILSYNLEGDFLNFTFGVWSGSNILREHWKRNMMSDEEFMRLTHKYLSPEHFYRGCNIDDNHARHTTSLEYVIDCFLSGEREEFCALEKKV